MPNKNLIFFLISIIGLYMILFYFYYTPIRQLFISHGLEITRKELKKQNQVLNKQQRNFFALEKNLKHPLDFSEEDWIHFLIDETKTPALELVHYESALGVKNGNSKGKFQLHLMGSTLHLLHFLSNLETQYPLVSVQNMMLKKNPSKKGNKVEMQLILQFYTAELRTQLKHR